MTVTDLSAGDPSASAERLFEAVQWHFELAADRIGLDEGAQKVLSTHRREVAVSVRVGMDDGLFEVYPGWRIQHSGARGPFKGGLRFHPNASRDEFRCFLALMTLKPRCSTFRSGEPRAACRSTRRRCRRRSSSGFAAPSSLPSR